MYQAPEFPKYLFDKGLADYSNASVAGWRLYMFPSIFLCLVVTFQPRFHSDYSSLYNFFAKKINQGTDVLTYKHIKLPASSFSIICVLKHVLTRLTVLTGSKINQKIKITETWGQLTVGMDCNYTFLSCPKMLTALSTVPVWGGGGGGVKRKVRE